MASTRFVFQASQEQFAPEDLLRQAVEAEAAGFDGVSSSDHFQPWWEGGESGHTWPWLGAAGHATERVLLGTGVTSTAARYHPALIAQAWMTLERLFPGRMFLGIGSGESLNETPVGDDWPSPPDQVDRMEEALEIVRRLWDGETLTQEGRYYATRDCRLWTRAQRQPPIWVSAFGPKAAGVAARWGDGVWTLAEPDQVKTVVDAYRGECDAIGREPGDVVLQAQVSWAPDDDAALEGIRMWKGSQPTDVYRDDWHVPRQMEAHGAQQIDDETLKQKAVVSADPAVHVERLKAIVDLGATVVVVQNNSGAAPHEAIRVYGDEVLPKLR